jgi:hypothetical protein
MLPEAKAILEVRQGLHVLCWYMPMLEALPGDPKAGRCGTVPDVSIVIRTAAQPLNGWQN